MGTKMVPGQDWKVQFEFINCRGLRPGYLYPQYLQDDSSLGELFTELPAHCVILLEDIDAVDATQSLQRGTGKPGQDETGSSTKGKSQGHKSFNVQKTPTCPLKILCLKGRSSKFYAYSLEVLLVPENKSDMVLKAEMGLGENR
ncbi:hypothetical protein B0J14DRAFT_642415, partial [Halenospora varia]